MYRFRVLKEVEPASFIKKVWFFSFIVILILLSTLFLPWEQTVRGTGTLIAFNPKERSYKIGATINGVIDKIFVKENQFVTKGTPLFSMIDLNNEYIKNLENIKNSIEEEIKNSKIEKNNLEEQYKNFEESFKISLELYLKKEKQIKRKIEQLKLQKEALDKRYNIEEIHFNRNKKLYLKGVVSKREYEVQESLYFKVKADLFKVNVSISIEEENIIINNQEKARFEVDTKSKLLALKNSILKTSNKIEILTQKEQNQKNIENRYISKNIIAKSDGYVIRVLKNDKNRFIKRGEDVVLFAPKVTKRAILLKISDFSMPLMKEELPARIMFYGWPALQISGWPKIRFGTFSGVIERVEPISYEKGFYYAYIIDDEREDPWPKDNILRVGTQATVWVRLKTVPLWYEVWRQINALPPKMQTPNKGKF